MIVSMDNDKITARCKRVENRLREHNLKIIREKASFGYTGEPALFLVCVNVGCGWRGWFRQSEAEWSIDAIPNED